MKRRTASIEYRWAEGKITMVCDGDTVRWDCDDGKGYHGDLDLSTVSWNYLKWEAKKNKKADG